MTELRYSFFFHLHNSKYLCQLIFHAKIEPKVSSGSGEEVDLVIFAIFTNGGHLGYST